MVDVNDKFVVMDVLTTTLAFNVNALVKVQSSCHLCRVLLNDLLPEFFTHHIVAVCQIYPPPPPYKEARAKGHCSINELRLLIEGDIKSTDQVAVLIANLEAGLSVELVTNLIHTLVKEEHLVNILKLLEKNLTRILLPWLQSTHQVHHKTLVYLIIPSIKRVCIWIFSARERKGTTECT